MRFDQGRTFADFRRLLEKYSKLEAIMVVGHNPNLSQFLGRSISESGCEAGTELKKGAVAKVEMRRKLRHAALVPDAEGLRTLYAAAAESSRPKTSRK
jgi:phosphohistidine phosphatase